jgi:hypothetical protein
VAIAIFERVAADTEHLLGPEHPDALAGRANLARARRESWVERRIRSVRDFARKELPPSGQSG